MCLTNRLQTGCNCLLVTFSCLVSFAKIHETFRSIFHFYFLLDDVRQGRTKWRNCFLGLYALHPRCYVRGKVGRIFTSKNENCVLGYPAACLQSKQPNQEHVCSLEFQCLDPALGCSLASGVSFLLIIKTICIKYF